jgi:hypothetical protein
MVTELSYATLALLSIFALGVGMLRTSSHRTKLRPSIDPSATTKPSAHLSTVQFDHMTRDQTWALIGEEYGPPDGVHDNDGSWLYYNLEVYDEDQDCRMRCALSSQASEGQTTSRRS